MIYAIRYRNYFLYFPDLNSPSSDASTTAPEATYNMNPLSIEQLTSLQDINSSISQILSSHEIDDSPSSLPSVGSSHQLPSVPPPSYDDIITTSHQ